MRKLGHCLTAGLALVLFPGASPAQPQLPNGVTQTMMDEGKKLYSGSGLCMVCHGPEGKGVPNLGANLTDAAWTHSDGSYEGILATVKAGVTSDKSTTGTVMPPKGGSNLSEDQLRAVAAYVWSMSKKK